MITYQCATVLPYHRIFRQLSDESNASQMLWILGLISLAYLAGCEQLRIVSWNKAWSNSPQRVCVCVCVCVFTFWTRSCFPLGLWGTFAFHKFLALWQGTSIILKMKVIYLKLLRWGFSNQTLSIYRQSSVKNTYKKTSSKNSYKSERTYLNVTYLQ